MTVTIGSFARRGPGVVFIVSAPSGAGKTTLTRRVLDVHSEMRLSVSCTTRAPRTGETQGEDYHFVSEPVFRRMLDAGEFAEWAEVHGSLYGTPRRMLERQLRKGQDVLLDIDVQGARQIKEHFQSAVSIFVLPPSLAELRRRLAARGTDARKTIEQRWLRARHEIQEITGYDYFIVNRDVDDAVARLAAIIAAERVKVCRFIQMRKPV
ncbi:MAG: guanylate kinase [Deltaproteobacteria bacterium]|nr:guanylate kinase [Deltaproteobacteria bacterium]